jgi:MFS transporter, MHS family, shikimate and dehydroshikimate transport protein
MIKVRNFMTRSNDGVQAHILPIAAPSGLVSMPKVAVASFIGAMLEWYDFFLFGTASALIFGPLFFPSANKTIGTALAFATFGVGFVARPLGGIFFGHMGDKYGRKVTLIATMVIIGVGTFLIGLMPTYASIGIWAPVGLIVLRVAQGFGLGGEYGGAALLTIEHAASGRRGFWGSLPQAAAATGLLIGTGVFTWTAQLPKDAFLSWGWRVPFLLSVLMLAVGVFIRISVLETPEFEQTLRAQNVARLPLLTLLRQHPLNTLHATCARLVETVIFNVTMVYGLAYVINVVGVPRSVPLTGIMVSAAVAIPLFPLVGLLSDRWGRREIYVAGCFFALLLAFPLFLLFNTGSSVAIVLAMVLSGVVSTSLYAVETTFFSEIFRANVRYTGLSFAYQFSAIIGGFVPLVAVGRSEWLVAAFLALTACMSGLSAYLAADVRGPVEAREEVSWTRPGESASGLTYTRSN